ncbi:hypothetical protein BH11CYA1_BH11CYA1_44950 [soil metagenome]
MKTNDAAEKTILSLDNLGIFASVLCLIHCLAMPFVVAAIPFIGMKWQWLQSETTENVLIAFIVGFAVFAIIPGYRAHKKPIALAGLTIGLALVAAVAVLRGHFPANFELPLISVGNLLLVGTHLLNRKLTHGSFLAHSHGPSCGENSEQSHDKSHEHRHGPGCKH